MTKTFMFDVHLLAAIRVPAETADEARKLLLDTIDSADSNLGAWPNGDPILAEVSVLGKDGGMDPAFLELVEEDDEAAHDDAVAPEDVTLLSAAEFGVPATGWSEPVRRRAERDAVRAYARANPPIIEVDPIAELAEIISPNISQAMRTMPR